MLRHQKIKHFNHVQYKHMGYIHVCNFKLQIKNSGTKYIYSYWLKTKLFRGKFDSGSNNFLDKDNFVYM